MQNLIRIRPTSCSNQSLFGRTELLPRLFWTHVQLWRLEIEKDLAITDIFNHIVFIQGLIYNILVDDQLKCENLNKSSSVSFLFTLVPKLKIPIPPRGPKSIIQAFVLSSSNTSLGLSLHGRLYAFQIQNTPQHLLELYLSQELLSRAE